MKKIKAYFDQLPEVFELKKKDGILIGGICILLGMIIGMLISPRRHQWYGCYNGSNFGKNMESDEICDESDGESE